MAIYWKVLVESIFQIQIGKGNYATKADLKCQDSTICCLLNQNDTPHPPLGPCQL